MQAVSVDGPLKRALEAATAYREAERQLTRDFQPIIGKPGQSSSPNGEKLSAQAVLAANVISTLGCTAKAKHKCRIADIAITEAFPTSFLGVMLEKPVPHHPRSRSDAYFTALVENGLLSRLVRGLLPGRRVFQKFEVLTNHDERAALVCAITALGVAANRYVAVGDANDGWIILPPVEAIAPWARKLLAEKGAYFSE